MDLIEANHSGRNGVMLRVLKLAFGFHETSGVSWPVKLLYACKGRGYFTYLKNGYNYFLLIDIFQPTSVPQIRFVSLLHSCVLHDFPS
jgi:hypothetical protein